MPPNDLYANQLMIMTLEFLTQVDVNLLLV